MNENLRSFGSQLLGCEKPTPAYREKYEKEKRAMFEKQLSPIQRIAFVFWTLFGLSLAAIFSCAAVVSWGDLPAWGTAIFAAGGVFGLAFALLSGMIAYSGRILLKWQPSAMTGLAWTFCVLVMTVSLVVAPGLPDPIVGLRMILSSLVFLVLAAVFMLANRTEQAELRTKEKLLEIEYRLATISEQIGALKSE